MREIKFRAWDGTDWVYSECISKDGINWWILNNEDDNWLVCLDPQQYTGLKDKNGKEIYEGDIVKLLHAAHEENEIGKIIYRDDEAAFRIFTNYLLERNLGSLVSSELEVVGNIYENPELLEESK
ncbi:MULTISPECIES: YopX family protein [unclassified Bacillus cereus group]|uniref:YopX family protein n=1 Tax=unclassified Bacillus cereus group TaxID=2750818 RepID=UPI001F59EA95|nr:MULTISPECIES: YopX family protein [unclassified Bacillus cereus group]